MAYCEKCGTKLTPGAAFCERCGTKVPVKSVVSGTHNTQSSIKAIYCEKCRSKLSPGSMFCEQCGTKVPGTEIPGRKPDKLYCFDGTDDNYLLFSRIDWSSIWKKKAGNATGYELGIILTNVSALASQLNVPAFEVERIIRSHIAAARKRGVEYCILRLDKNSVRFDVSERNSIRDVEDIVALLRQVIDVARPKYLFILGNEDIVEVATWENEADTRSHDQDVDSDFVYSVLDTTSPWEGQDFNLNEALRVGRLPTTDGDFEGFQRYFENAAEGIGAFDEIKAYGLSAKVWAEESQFEFEHFRNDAYYAVETSPEVEADDTISELAETEANILFFNLHGSSEDKTWYGQEGYTYPKAVLPDAFYFYSVPFFLGVEACYGARYIGLPPKESIVKTAMRNRCLAFLGSSRIAMGASAPQFRCCADIVIGDYLKHVACGETAGDAHILSLQALIRKSRSEYSGALTPDDVLTIAEFSLYGDPSSCTGRNKNIGMAKSMFKTFGGVPKGLRVPVPDVLKAAKMYLAEVNAEIEAKVDSFATQFLPFSREDELRKKSIHFSHNVYRMQNGKLFNKTYSFDTAIGMSFVSVYFDKNGRIRNAAISK